MNKYSSQQRFGLQSVANARSALGSALDPNAGVSEQAYNEIINSAIARTTWGKYSSALNTFACYEASCCQVYEWPLPLEVCRAFVVWCHTQRKLQTSTIRAYLAGIKFAHTLKGLSSSHLQEDPILALLLKGITHIAEFSNKHPNTRRVVTLPMLLLLGHRISLTNWSPLSKQVVFAACTTGFFASARMGEILAKAESVHATDSDLTWKDVKESSSTSILLRFKVPKSGEKAEFVDLFPFPGHGICPVAALRALRKLQHASGLVDDGLPVFRFADGKNLTQAKFNRILANLLSDMCVPGVNTISCHSFRAGIPSTISLFPHLATSDLIKGWGRWASDCYTRYTRLKLSQRENIFSQISDALHSVMPTS